MITRTFGARPGAAKMVTVGQAAVSPSTSSDSNAVLPIVLVALGFALVLDAARNKI